MKIKISKVIYLVICIMFSICITSNIKAATIGLSSTKPSVYVGETFNVNISGINGKVTITSSSNVSLSISGTQWVDGSMSISATANSTGTATITVTPIDATTTAADPEVVDKANSVYVTINEKVTNNTNTNNNGTNNNANNTNNSNNSNTSNNNLSSNANLSNLVIDQEGLTPMFSSNVTSYSLVVPEKVTSLNITPTMEQAGAKYWITGEENLQMGKNVVTITVTAPNGNKKTYTINVDRVEDTTKADSALKTLIIDGIELTPTFAPDTLEYDLGTINIYNLEKLTILAFANSDNAKVEIQGNENFKEGENVIKVIVTAEDGKTTREYVLKFIGEKPIIETLEEDEYQYVYDELTKWEIFKSNIKENKLLLIVLAVAIIELIEIIILYRKVYVKKDNDFEEEIETLNSDVNEESKDNEQDNQNFKKRRRGNLEDSTNLQKDEKEEQIDNESSEDVENVENSEEQLESKDDIKLELNIEDLPQEEVNEEEKVQEDIEEVTEITEDVDEKKEEQTPVIDFESLIKETLKNYEEEDKKRD